MLRYEIPQSIVTVISFFEKNGNVRIDQIRGQVFSNSEGCEKREKVIFNKGLANQSFFIALMLFWISCLLRCLSFSKVLISIIILIKPIRVRFTFLAESVCGSILESFLGILTFWEFFAEIISKHVNTFLGQHYGRFEFIFPVPCFPNTSGHNSLSQPAQALKSPRTINLSLLLLLTTRSRE